MNEIGPQQAVVAKTRSSAPERPAGGLKDTNSSEADPKVFVESSQTEKSNQSSMLEKKAEEKTENSVEQAVAKLNDYVQNTERKLEFQVDDDSGETVVRVYDKMSDELIRQIPNEEALELAQKLNQEEPLMLFSAQV